MTTTTRINDLQTLGQILQMRLTSAFPDIEDLIVQCVVKDGALMLLAQHPVDVELDPERTFSVLEQSIHALQPEFSNQIKMYLRVAGQRRPYAFHRCTLDTITAQENLPEMPVEEYHHEGLFLENPFQWGEPAVTENNDIEDEIPSPVADLEDEAVAVTEPESEAQFIEEPVANYAEEEVSFESLDEPESVVTQTTAPKKPIIPIPSLPVMAAAAGVSLIFFIGSLYALTRPCVIGSCTEIADAQSLINTSKQLLQRPQSGKDILLARQQLGQAINILTPIPAWSSHHQQAEQLLKTYQAQAIQLDQVTNALSKANIAAKKSQNPPHSVGEWTEIQQLWRQTILDLEQVPRDSIAYNLAQQRQKSYKANLVSANKRLATEQQAKRSLEAGKEAAKIAAARAGVADSLQTWESINNSWQTAVNKLNSVPLGTTSYEEAQQLLKEYQNQVVVARDRAVQEQFAANVYKQSLVLAQQAKLSQDNNQWSQAVSNWRNALANIKQVPTGTFYYNKTQPLINAYTDALKQAENQFQFASIIEQARQSLTQTCGGKTPICTFTVSSNVIKVRLTPAYMQIVQKTALAAKMKGDNNAQLGVVNHISTLEEALKVISDNAGIRLEIYTPDDVIRQTHQPGT